MQTQTVYKQIGFSSEMYAQLQKRAKELGMSFAAYMRMLAKIDLTKTEEEISMVDEETEKQIGRSLADYKAGKYTVLKTKEDIINHFKNL